MRTRSLAFGPSLLGFAAGRRGVHTRPSGGSGLAVAGVGAARGPGGGGPVLGGLGRAREEVLGREAERAAEGAVPERPVVVEAATT